MDCQSFLQGNLPDPGIELMPLMSPALAGGFFITIWEGLPFPPSPFPECSIVGITVCNLFQISYFHLLLLLLLLSRFSRVRLCATPWTVARQVPLPMGFSRQEYWRGLPCPPPGDLPDPGIEPMSSASPALQANSLPLSHREI